jgi:hypothetical protein
LTKGNKRKEPKIKFLAHELLAFALSYLMLALWWYTNPSNLSSRTPHMSSLVILCLSSYYRFVLLSHYELVPPRAFVAYVQTISSDVAWASIIVIQTILIRKHKKWSHMLCLLLKRKEWLKKGTIIKIWPPMKV